MNSPSRRRAHLVGTGEHAGHGADSLAFQDMKPGFHVTTGSAVILWHPDSSVRGDFTIESTRHLFDTKGRDREKNVLAVKAAGPTVQFLVNGQVVHSAPRASMNPDGLFGIGANHSVNLHVQTIGRAP